MNDYSRIKPMRVGAFTLLALGAACLLAADRLSAWALFFGPICLAGGLHFLRRASRLTSEMLFDLAVHSVGLVREDERFSSMKPMLVAHRTVGDGLPRFECLCRDRTGHWTVYRFALLARRPADVQIEPIGESQARRWLQPTPAVYAKWFAEAR